MDMDNSMDLLSETENLMAWRNKDDELGYVYHLELGTLSLHLTPEEWEELVVLIKGTIK